MGLLATLAGIPDDDNGNGLGLSSHYRMPTEVRRERDREVGRSIARAQVIEADIRGIEHVAGVAMHAVSNVTAAAEIAAARLPEERARVDAIADTVAVVLARKVAELGGAG